MAGAVQTMLREVMDIRQAADYLGISSDSLYRYASDGLMPAFKLGNRWRFKRSLLDGWMIAQSSAGQAGQEPLPAVVKQKKQMASVAAGPVARRQGSRQV